MEGLGWDICDEVRAMVQDESCWAATPREIHEWCTHERWRQ